MKKFTLISLGISTLALMIFAFSGKTDLPPGEVNMASLEIGPSSDQDQPKMQPAWYRFFDEQKNIKPIEASTSQNLGFVFIKDKEDGEFFHFRLVNLSEEALSIRTQDGSLIMIREAKNPQGQWQPIEYWDYDWGFGSYFEQFQLEPEQSISLTAPHFDGDYETEIRFKLKVGDKKDQSDVYYSPSYKGMVYLSQFKNSQDPDDETISYLEK